MLTILFLVVPFPMLLCSFIIILFRRRILVRRHYFRPTRSLAGLRRQDQGLLWGTHSRRRRNSLHFGWIRILWHSRQGGQVDSHLDQKGRSHDPSGGMLPSIHLRRDRLHPGHAFVHWSSGLDAFQPPPGGPQVSKILRRDLLGRRKEGGGLNEFCRKQHFSMESAMGWSIHVDHYNEFRTRRYMLTQVMIVYF